jgi:tripartite ATP-independent transporter DctM subunit
MSALYIYLATFGIFFLIGVPVVLSLAMGGLLLLFAKDIPIVIFAQQWLMSQDNFSLTAIFYFMLAGELMNIGGLTKRIVGLASKLVGNRVGGLATIAGVASMLFAAINGSAIATAVAIGSMLVPAMVKEKYDASFSGAVVSAGGVIGPIIPPSIPMILYGTITGVSISKLFIGGVGLGMLLVIAQIIVSYRICKKRGYKGGESVELVDTKGSIWAMILPVFLFVTIAFGILTPTESSAMAVVYSFIVSVFIYKELDLKKIPKVIEASFKSTSVTMAVVGAASVAAWILTSEQIPQKIAEAIIAICKTPTQFMILTFFTLIIVGMIMDLTPAILILAPVFMEPVRLLGVDPVYFGVFFCATLVVGLITPPVGTLIFTGCSLSGRSFSEVTKDLAPYAIVCLAIIILAIFFPQIITFLPNLLG